MMAEIFLHLSGPNSALPAMVQVLGGFASVEALQFTPRLKDTLLRFLPVLGNIRNSNGQSLQMVEMPPRNRHRYHPVITDALEDGEGVSDAVFLIDTYIHAGTTLFCGGNGTNGWSYHPVTIKGSIAKVYSNCTGPL